MFNTSLKFITICLYFSSMLKDFDMELQLRQNFYDFFAERRYNTDDIQLLHRMKAFDPRKVCYII